MARNALETPSHSYKHLVSEWFSEVYKHPRIKYAAVRLLLLSEKFNASGGFFFLSFLAVCLMWISTLSFGTCFPMIVSQCLIQIIYLAANVIFSDSQKCSLSLDPGCSSQLMNHKTCILVNEVNSHNGS